jgi:hypothetical protein
MRYFYYIPSLLLLSTFFALFINGTAVSAAAIVRPPNNLGLVGYWSFDEGRGTHASDMSGNGNNGTFAGNPLWVSGRLGRSLDFNGSTDYVSVANSTSLSFGTAITQAAWVNVDSCNSNATIATKVNAYYFQVHSDCKIATYTYPAAGGSSAYTYSTSAIPLNRWTHVVFTEDPTGLRKMYIDGVLDNTIQREVGVQTSSAPLTIGSEVSSRRLNGTIDEVRIYNRALSASEVYSLYANTKSTIVGVTPTDRYNNGLVAHWTFDGKHTTATTVEDVVGNNDGTIIDAAPTRGIVGQGMEFGGGTSVVSVSPVPQIATNAITVSAWFKTNSLGFSQAIVRKNGLSGTNYDYVLRIHETSNMIAWGAGKIAGNISGVEGFVVTPGVWYHVVGTKTDSGSHSLYVNGNLVSTSARTSAVASGESLYLGGTGLSSIDGSIDDVRIYNRALSANEIAGLYLATKSSVLGSVPGGQTVSGGLIGLWTFDQGSGTQANDSSSQSNHGTLIGGPTWITGKVGSRALQFDGVDDYVALPTPVEEGTINLRTDMGLVSVRNISLTHEGVEGGWKKYSISGSWDTSSYPYSMAVSNYPFVGGTTYTTSAFIKTNVPEKFDTVFTNAINYVNQPQNKGGVGSSTIMPDESRYLVRRDFEYTPSTTQLGYLFSRPVQNATFNPATDFVYIRSGQIEQKSYPTSFVDGTRTSSVVTSTLWIRPVSTGVWEHVAYNSSQYFKNGVVGNPTAYPLAGQSIGRSVNGLYFEGAIDDVRIYNRALTEAEITQLYSMGQ